MKSQLLMGSNTVQPAAQPLTDSEALVTLLDTLRHRTVRELRLALPRRPYDQGVREQAALLSSELVRRGAQVRVLHVKEVSRDPAYAENTRRIAASGARMRVLSYLPVWMAIADRDFAIVQSDPGLDDAHATLLRGWNLVGAYRALFDHVWARSAGPAVPEERDALDEREREALVLLAEGLTDEGISRRTGLSVRTIRRTIAGVMARMGVQSRFQAGVEAARRQWI
ncbi:LuxR C-terminal-related transcriptional regulator [Streptomyces goshikiensis]|uniref:helix-turn-helix transcriptional regulator n=1 Tax=Streptomyces goshikiensis TaxID=1942 RepID=UPI0036B3FA96